MITVTKKVCELYYSYKLSPVFSLAEKSPELHEFIIVAFGGA